MKDIDEITSALAQKYGGHNIDEGKKKEPPPAPAANEYSTGNSSGYSTGYTRSTTFASGAKVFPSEKMELRAGRLHLSKPKRPQILIATYSDDDLEWMLSTPVKRGWTFEDYLEVIGLPRDLHEKYDESIYGYVARAFLREKAKAHQR